MSNTDAYFQNRRKRQWTEVLSCGRESPSGHPLTLEHGTIGVSPFLPDSINSWGWQLHCRTPWGSKTHQSPGTAPLCAIHTVSSEVYLPLPSPFSDPHPPLCLSVLCLPLAQGSSTPRAGRKACPRICCVSNFLLSCLSHSSSLLQRLADRPEATLPTGLDAAFLVKVACSLILATPNE